MNNGFYIKNSVVNIIIYLDTGANAINKVLI